LGGGTWAAIELCGNNLQMELAPRRNQSSYFAIAAAVAGVSGAVGITAGGFIATATGGGGIVGLFALSAILRLAALLALVFVREQRSVPLSQLIRVRFPALRGWGETPATSLSTQPVTVD
jgi:MFS family permease